MLVLGGVLLSSLVPQVFSDAYVGVSLPDHGIVRVGRVTGERTVLSDATHGNGPPFTAVQDVVMTPFHLYATDLAPAVFRVDLATGDRVVVSGITPGTGTPVGSGPAFQGLTGIELFDAQTALVLDHVADVLYSVNLSTGQRTVVSNAGDAGPAFVTPLDVHKGIGFDPNLYVLDPGLGALLRVDPLSGDRAVVTSNSTGTGPLFTFPISLEIDRDGSFLVADPSGSRILRVTGQDRTEVSGPSRGLGPSFFSPSSIVLAPQQSNGCPVDPHADYWVTDSERFAVVTVDRESGNRHVISGCAGTSVFTPSCTGIVGMGPPFVPRSVTRIGVPSLQPDVVCVPVLDGFGLLALALGLSWAGRHACRHRDRAPGP